MIFNAMQLVTFLRNIYYRRCVFLVFLVSVPIATSYDSTISRHTIKNKRFHITPEVIREINDRNNEHLDHDTAQPQFRYETTVNPKIDDVKLPKLHYKVESPEKFIWFIHNVIKILTNYNDNDLKYCFDVINTELDKYEKSESHHLSRYLSSELNKVKNMSAAVLRKQLLTIDASMEKENQEKRQQQLTDYINSLYGSDYVEKFLIFMFNIDDYRFMMAKSIDLESTLTDGLKSIIFDHYSKLDNISREKFISSINRYFKYITKSPSLIGGNERDEDDEREFKLSGGNNVDHTAIQMKKMVDNITLGNVKGTINPIEKYNYKTEPHVNEFFSKRSIKSTWSTVTHQSVKAQSRYRTIEALKPVNARGLLTNKATFNLKNTELKSTTSKQNIFIDIESPTYFKVPVEHKVQRKEKKLPALHKKDYRRTIDGNETAERFDIKNKVLARLFQLENDIKLVKSQIDNDSRTIKDLEDQIHRKEKERAKLNLIRDKKNIEGKNQIEVKNSSNQKAMRRNFERHSLEKIMETMKSNFSQFGKDKTESTSDKIYETQQNTSQDENVPDFIGVTPNIFDVLDDVKYETFENYDGGFDFEKFVTSNLYIQQLKNSTLEILDGRRMLDEELTTPIFNPEEYPPIEPLEDKPEFWNEYDMNEPRETTIFTLPPLNITHNPFVPQPGANKIVDSMGISLEIPDALDMKKSDETEQKYDFSPNLKFDLLNRRRMLPNSQSMIPVLETRGNTYTSTTIFDKILNDPIIRDIDKVVEF